MTAKFKLVSPQKFKEVEPLAELVEGTFSHPSLNLLFAPSGAMKSWFALALAKSLTQGVSFLGMKVPNTRKVLYADFEMSKQTVKQRLIQTKLIDQENFYLIERLAAIDLSKTEDMQELQKLCLDNEIEVLIIDNLRSSTQLDESKADSFNQINANLCAIRDSGITVLLVHHSNKSAESYSGSSNIITPFETALGLTNTNDLNTKQINVTKSRDGVINAIHETFFSINGEGQAIRGLDGIAAECKLALDVSNKLEACEFRDKAELETYLRDNGYKGKSDKFTYRAIAEWLYENNQTTRFIKADLIRDQLAVSAPAKPFPTSAVMEVTF